MFQTGESVKWLSIAPQDVLNEIIWLLYFMMFYIAKLAIFETTILSSRKLQIECNHTSQTQKIGLRRNNKYLTILPDSESRF